MKIFDKIKRYISPSLLGGVGVGSFLLWKGVGVGIFVACCLAACTADDGIPSGQNTEGADPVGQPVQFVVANEGTRAETYYMPDGSHFVCNMYYHAKSADTDNSDFATGDTLTAWLRVNGNVGNSLYWNNKYNPDVMPSGLDQNVFDNYGYLNVSRFTWKNRKSHMFFAYTDLNHPAMTAEATSGQYFNCNAAQEDAAYGLILSDETQYATRTDGRHYYNRVWVSTQFDKDQNGKYKLYGEMKDQPDPAIAVTVKKPEAGTTEGNRVYLTFKHQLAQVHVNLKNAEDGSVNLANEASIISVELLGVSQQAYVPTMPAIIDNSNGALFNMDDPTQIVASGTQPTWCKKATVEHTYTPEELFENEYGSSFSMFRNTNAIPTDYLSHFEGIAFGTLGAIRITWKEETDGNIIHVVTYNVDTDNTDNTNEPFNILKSGYKYIFNIELRRATLYVISTEIVPWEMNTTYETSASQVVN